MRGKRKSYIAGPDFIGTHKYLKNRIKKERIYQVALLPILILKTFPVVGCATKNKVVI
jgi:hypothetical protein